MNRYIYKCFVALGLFAMTATGCTDDLNCDDSVEEGLPAEITVKVSLPDMNIMSRADMAPGLDGEVNSLWVGVYSASSGELTGSTTVNNLSANPTHENPENVTIKAKTGRSYIVAVANYAGRSVHDGERIVTFEAALENATSLDKFKALSTMFNSNGDVNPDVPLNTLLMSGHYIAGNHADGDYTTPETVLIPRTGSLSGAIHLRRLISQVKFNVTYNQDNISDFDIVSWQVKNIPNQSWVYEQNDANPLNVGDTRSINSKASYQNSSVYTQTDQNVAEHKWSFDWWQLENKRTGLDPSETYNKNGDYYSYREVEFKDNNLNTGKYASLVNSATSDDPNNNATFVELKVRMTMKVDEDGKTLPSGQTRIADAVYTVHLGYCEGSGKDKAMDFNCRRNTKYTYDVTVNNVNDILVEARKLGENAPGAEGVVADVTAQYVELDAHYGVYNIYLTAEDLEDFDYMISCYDANSNLITIDSTDPTTIPAARSDNRKYLDWIEIRKPESQSGSALALYHPDNVITLDEFKTAVDNATDKSTLEGWYTLFFNEYVYDENANGNESGSTHWRDYVNKPDRQVWIRIQLDQSTDKESSHYVSKYAFSQKSIQTYYNSASGTALGMEHTNESLGLNLRNTFNNGTVGQTEDNGRFNVAQFIAGRRNNNNFTWATNGYAWSNFVTLASPQTVNEINNLGVVREEKTVENPYPVPALVTLSNQTQNKYDPDQSSAAKYIQAINACMNRNRDLDGDGRIDANELRWFVPTTNIYVRMILGRRSLATPIMNYAQNRVLPYDDSGKLNSTVTSLMLYGSNGKILWAMEGISTSAWTTQNGNNDDGWPRSTLGAPWEVRCVRNLGTDLRTVSSTPKADPAYRIRPNATRTIEMIYYDPKSVRQEKITQMVPHDIANQDYNRCYKAFQYAETDYNISACTGYNAAYLTDNGLQAWLKASNPCDRLNNATTGSTGWRVPNQKEIVIMSTQNIRPSSGFYISATFSHYDTGGKGLNAISDLDDTSRTFKVMMVRSDGDGTQRTFRTDDQTLTRRIRCVRDVD